MVFLVCAPQKHVTFGTRECTCAAHSVPIEWRDRRSVANSVPIARRDRRSVVNSVPIERRDRRSVTNSIPIERRDHRSVANSVRIQRRDRRSVANSVRIERRGRRSVANSCRIASSGRRSAATRAWIAWPCRRSGTNSIRTELRDCRSVAPPSRHGAGTQDLGRGARESDSSWSFSAALWSPASPGCGFPYFCNGYDVASAPGDPPTFYWSVLREPSLVFPSPLVFSLVFPVLLWPSMAFLGAPWCF